jgi:hypothetical protein
MQHQSSKLQKTERIQGAGGKQLSKHKEKSKHKNQF